MPVVQHAESWKELLPQLRYGVEVLRRSGLWRILCAFAEALFFADLVLLPRQLVAADVALTVRAEVFPDLGKPFPVLFQIQ
jgi:hypothetical protein